MRNTAITDFKINVIQNYLQTDQYVPNQYENYSKGLR